MHGGGDISVKTGMPDLFREPVDMLRIKGSGRDLATIEPDAHPAVRPAPLHRLRSLERPSDEDMINARRQNLLDTAAPNPSVETLLRAYLPHKSVDHIHAAIPTALACLPDREALRARVFRGRFAFVPCVMRGSALAQSAAPMYKPGRMRRIAARQARHLHPRGRRTQLVRADDRVRHNGRGFHPRSPPAISRVDPVALPPQAVCLGDLPPLVRGLPGEASLRERVGAHWLLGVRSGEWARRLADGHGVADYACRGVATPEQVVRIKGRPAILPPVSKDVAAWQQAAATTIASYVDEYKDYAAILGDFTSITEADI